MISTIINKKLVLGHPYFKRYGADDTGVVFNLLTHLRAKRYMTQGLVFVILKDELGYKYTVPRSIFNYECFNQCIYIAEMPTHLDNDLTNDSKINLHLAPVRKNLHNLHIII